MALHALVLAALLAAGTASGGDPLVRLEGWLARARSSPHSIDSRRKAELRDILAELRLARSSGADPAQLDLALVELASLEWREGGAEDAPVLLASARLGRAELETQLLRARDELSARLAEDVLAPAARRPRGERVAAATLLERAHAPATLDALRSAARDRDLDVARAGLEALCGWPDPLVHLFFLEELKRRAPCARVAARHFEATREDLGDAALDALRTAVATLYLSGDWRDAARARGLVGVLDASRAVPVLIEALALWARRSAEGEGSRRIRGEIHEELRRVSGRSIAPEPALWSAWWEGVRDGRVALPDELEAAGIEGTSASFFGLRAETERVLFVVDRSGSMRAGFGTDGRSRYEAAIEQMATFLRQSGPETRFSVALFSKDGVAWRGGALATATESNLAAARRWLESTEPDGETRLFEGLRAGLGLDSRGRIDAQRCEADTVIVLCDGATTEGPGWVERWLAEENERAQLVFHCVQIGSEGNGTLEALSEGTGGALVVVSG